MSSSMSSVDIPPDELDLKNTYSLLGPAIRVSGSVTSRADQNSSESFSSITINSANGEGISAITLVLGTPGSNLIAIKPEQNILWQGSGIELRPTASPGISKLEQSDLIVDYGRHKIHLEMPLKDIHRTTITLRDSILDDRENLTKEIADTVTLWRTTLSDRRNSIQDQVDVLNLEWQHHRMSYRNSVMFLNDSDNICQGFNNSDDIIYGQGGKDILMGLSGNDVLIGGADDDILVGGEGSNYLIGNAGADTFVLSVSGFNQVADFTVGEDVIGLADGLTFDRLRIEPGPNVNSSSTWIKLATNDTLLLSLSGVIASTLTTDAFRPTAYPSPLNT
jgi:Ca2+-binding RTX toxin-like protein